MTVDAILKAKGRDVQTCPATATVAEAVALFTRENIGALVVTPDGERVEGVASERDVVRGLARHGARLLAMPVGQVMSDARQCSGEDTLAHVMALMTQTRQRHLVVVDGGRLCGVISIGDIVKSRLQELALEVAVLRDAYIARH